MRLLFVQWNRGIFRRQLPPPIDAALLELMAQGSQGRSAKHGQDAHAHALNPLAEALENFAIDRANRDTALWAGEPA